MNKPKNTPCKHVARTGCAVHNMRGFPKRECGGFHCSDVSSHMKWGFIHQAETDHLITKEEGAEARKLWIIS